MAHGRGVPQTSAARSLLRFCRAFAADAGRITKSNPLGSYVGQVPGNGERQYFPIAAEERRCWKLAGVSSNRRASVQQSHISGQSDARFTSNSSNVNDLGARAQIGPDMWK